jgi:hypothetical protein
VIHVVQVLEPHALDVLAEAHSLLHILIVSGVLGEDGIVDDDAVYAFFFVCLHDLLLEEFLVYVSKVKLESTAGRWW